MNQETIDVLRAKFREQEVARFRAKTIAEYRDVEYLDALKKPTMARPRYISLGGKLRRLH